MGPEEGQLRGVSAVTGAPWWDEKDPELGPRRLRKVIQVVWFVIPQPQPKAVWGPGVFYKAQAQS